MIIFGMFSDASSRSAVYRNDDSLSSSVVHRSSVGVGDRKSRPVTTYEFLPNYPKAMGLTESASAHMKTRSVIFFYLFHLFD
jgi:hypothetical protein